jgi:hypothetical protein
MKHSMIKLVIFGIILGIGLYLFIRLFIIVPILQKNSQSYAPAVTTLSSGAKSDPMQFLATLSNVEVIVPGILGKDDPEGLFRVKLRDNQADFSDGETHGTISLNGLLKTQQTADGVDLFCDLVVNYGGSGNFHFVALFKKADSSLVHTSSVSIGDRIKIVSVNPETVIGNNYQVRVDYLDRGIDEAMVVAPTVEKEFTFLVKNHKINQ